MNHVSKFEGASSEFLQLLTSLAEKSKKYPAINRDLDRLSAFYDMVADMFKEADADLINQKTVTALYRFQVKFMEEDYVWMLDELLKCSSGKAEAHLDKFIASKLVATNGDQRQNKKNN